MSKKTFIIMIIICLIIAGLIPFFKPESGSITKILLKKDGCAWNLPDGFVAQGAIMLPDTTIRLPNGAIRLPDDVGPDGARGIGGIQIGDKVFSSGALSGQKGNCLTCISGETGIEKCKINTDAANSAPPLDNRVSELFYYDSNGECRSYDNTWIIERCTLNQDGTTTIYYHTRANLFQMLYILYILLTFRWG